MASSRWWDTNLCGGISELVETTAAHRKSYLQQAAAKDFTRIKSQRFLFNAGKDNKGQPVFILHNKNFYERSNPNFWNNMFLYILKELASQSEPFTVVYVHDSRVQLPSFHWFRRLFLFSDPEARSRLQSMYILNSSPGSNAVACFVERLLKVRVVGALVKLDKAEQLSAYMPPDVVAQVSALAPTEQSVPSSIEFTAIKNGSLQKMAGKALLGVKVWKKRWVVLTEETLQYYASSTAQEPKGVILLEGGSIELEHKKRKNSFALQPAGGGDVLYFSCSSPEEVEEWRGAIARQQRVNAVFGVPLEDHLRASCRPDGLPMLVERCITEILNRGLEKEGVLRVGGSINRIQQLKRVFDVVGDAEVAAEPDVHTVVGLLKMYLRELPEPVIPSASYSAVVHALDGAESGEDVSEQQLGTLREVLGDLPDCNKRLLLEMLKLGAVIASEHQKNMMPALNVATVLGPNILRPEASRAEDAVIALVEAPLVNRACLALICHLESLEDVLHPNRASVIDEGAFYERYEVKLSGAGLEGTGSGRSARKERPLSMAYRHSVASQEGGASDPSSPSSLARVGSSAKSLRGTGEVERCQAIVDQTPESAEGWERLAAAFHDTHQYERALQAYDKAIELNPSNGQNYIRVGLISEMSGDFEKAKEYYTKCKKLAGGMIAQQMLQDLSRRMQEHTAASNRNSEVGSKDWEGSSNGRLSCGRESTGA